MTPDELQIHKTYDLHKLLQLTEMTSYPITHPAQNNGICEEDSDSSTRLRRELFHRRSNSPEELSQARRWFTSDSDTDLDSCSEINIIALNSSTGRISRISRIPIDLSIHSPIGTPQVDPVPIPPDLKGRLQKLERRARVEVLHDVRPKRQLTEQEEFIAWMNKDGVRMLLTPASHAALKPWLDGEEYSPPESSGSSTTLSSPCSFRVCVEEDSDIEGAGSLQPLEVKVTRAAEGHISMLSADYPTPRGGIDDEDEGNDADVED